MDTLSLTKEARTYNGLKTISLTSGAGKSGQPLVKNETRTLSNTIHKNKLKMDKDLNIGPETIQLLEVGHRGSCCDFFQRVFAYVFL